MFYKRNRSCLLTGKMFLCRKRKSWKKRRKRQRRRRETNAIWCQPRRGRRTAPPARSRDLGKVRGWHRCQEKSFKSEILSAFTLTGVKYWCCFQVHELACRAQTQQQRVRTPTYFWPSFPSITLYTCCMFPSTFTLITSVPSVRFMAGFIFLETIKLCTMIVIFTLYIPHFLSTLTSHSEYVH